MSGLDLPRLNLAWFTPPAHALLPTIAVAMFGDNGRETLRQDLRAWFDQWQRQLGIEARNPAARAEDMAANGFAYLLLILASQTRNAVEDAAQVMAAAAELGFREVLLSVRGQTLGSEIEQLSRRCSITVLAEEQEQLLHPLRLLLSPSRMIGYDNADVFAIWRGRVGWVVRVDHLAFTSLGSILSPSGGGLSGTVLLMLSNAEDALALADTLGSLVRAQASSSDLLWALNRHGEAEDFVELAILTERPE